MLTAMLARSISVRRCNGCAALGTKVSADLAARFSAGRACKISFPSQSES